MTNEVATRAYYYWHNGHDDEFLNWLLAEEVQSVSNLTNFAGTYEQDMEMLNNLDISSTRGMPRTPKDQIHHEQDHVQDLNSIDQLFAENQDKPKNKKPFWKKSPTNKLRKVMAKRFGRKATDMRILIAEKK